MKELYYDGVVIGGGAAGMAAALELAASGFSAAIIDREDHLGGILMQCIHNGFGLHEFGEELTGPEFAERLIHGIAGSRIALYLNTTVTSIGSGSDKELFCVSPDLGVLRIRARAVILAMGCRERNRGNVRIPGSRPAGVFTAGLAQRLVNIEGYIPGKEVVVIGSGDIGLIMARRMSWVGCLVKAVVEIMPYPAGLTRNIVQCLRDFDIPLYLSCQTTNIFGNDRVEGVEVTPMENGALSPDKRFRIDCDTVLLSVGLVPENELSKAAGVELNGATNGPVVDSRLMTSVEGIFACGNVLHVHDLVDWVVEESRRAGRFAAAWLKGEGPGAQVRVKAGSNVRYVNPGRIDLRGENQVYLRSLIVKNDARLELRLDNRVIRSVKKDHVQPSEMINLCLGPKDLENPGFGPDSVLEFSIL
ncbi:MAG: NAD(P)/FAD-dependent oxidoreductase [Spirochaetaceae bacterium]|jgi:NADPH-dependent 2,4-dienoyl-CoA reductase/sulfur reductase-like enzyme|nr:NAD(P)/FAD-dependent oxidoreductase [Spirochaetaceae bacterium]